MANANFHEKKWKHLSIWLMAVLGVGFLFPQAFADQMGATINNILSIVQDIQAKVTNTNNIVTTNLDAKVSSRATPMKVTKAFARSDIESLDEVQCTSSSDSIAHVSLITRGSGGALDVSPGYGFYDIKETGYLEFGQTANIPIVFKAIATAPDFVSAHVTIETEQGATVQCTNS